MIPRKEHADGGLNPFRRPYCKPGGKDDTIPASEVSAVKTVICNIEYDTEASEALQKKTYGNFGDPWGFEETLYRTKDGKYFVYCFGGFNSPYPKETIKRLAAGLDGGQSCIGRVTCPPGVQILPEVLGSRLCS